MPTTTVREAIAFSAALRTTPEQRGPGGTPAVVQYTLGLLELEKLADRRVSSLSQGELKRLTMAVEVASLAGVCYFDEPTTGLSARAAAVVVRCLQRIAARGCSVVCTIHQPSTSLFFGFTHLLLLGELHR